MLLSDFSDGMQLDTKSTIVREDGDGQGVFAIADSETTALLLLAPESLFSVVESKPADTAKLVTQEFKTVLYMYTPPSAGPVSV